MKRKLLPTLAAGLSICFTLSGCSMVKEGIAQLESAREESAQKESAATFETATEETVPPLSEGLTEDEAQELYNLYVETNNVMVGRLYDSLNRYFEYVEFQEEFLALEDDYLSCYSISEYDRQNMDAAYELVSRKAEYDALDTSFINLYPVLTSIIDVLNEYEEYADMKSFLDDDYAKAKEYHAQLWADLGEYDALAAEFYMELDKEDAMRTAEAMQQMKEDGYVITYAINSVILSAQALQNEFYYQEVYDENILDMDMEVIQPLYDQFVSDVNAVLEYSKDENALSEEGIPVNSAYWHSFLSAIKDTKTSMTEVLQKVKDGEELSYTDTLIDMPGNCSLSSFDAGISSMINNYNNMLY